MFLAWVGALFACADPLPVERIEPGMMVLSAPESGTGASSFRPVAGLSRNRVDEVVRIGYDHDASPATPDETVTASTGHPLWIEEARAFVPAAEVRSGQHLRMAEEGRSAAVAAVTRQRAPPGPGLAVFNFSVAGHHTYFAGNGGVWVHNLCTEGLERIAARFNLLFEAELKNLDGVDNPAAYEQAARRIRDAIRSEFDLDENEAAQGLCRAGHKNQRLCRKIR